jgi:hypothetical protein
VALIVDGFFGAELQGVFQETAEGEDGEEHHQRADETEFAVGFRGEEADQHQHGGELEEVAEDVQAGDPEDAGAGLGG